MMQHNELHVFTQALERTSALREPGPSRQLDVYRKKLEYDRLRQGNLAAPGLFGDIQPVRFDRIRRQLSNTLVRIADAIRPVDGAPWGTETNPRQSGTGAPFIFSSRN
jgi:hypothetical protein